MMRKIKAQHNYISNSDDKFLSLINSVNEYLSKVDQPKNFNYSDPNNYISSFRKSFSHICTSLEELGINNPSKLTVFDFNSKVEYFERKFKKK